MEAKTKYTRSNNNVKHRTCSTGKRKIKIHNGEKHLMRGQRKRAHKSGSPFPLDTCEKMGSEKTCQVK